MLLVHRNSLAEQRNEFLTLPLLELNEPLISNFRGYAQFPTSWSPDGKHVLFTNEHDETGLDVWVLPMDDLANPYAILNSVSDETGAVFSPNGKWFAYQSDHDEERYEVYLSEFSSQGRPVGRPKPISNPLLVIHLPPRRQTSNRCSRTSCRNC